jgi:uncharacterized Ntn-hydrolase superfamily protein
MIKKLLVASFCIATLNTVAQDTFSIVAADSITGEVGSAGASCVDMFNTPYSNDFLGELFPGVGAINTQASYDPTNQANARKRMNAGDSPSQIMAWLSANDVNGNPSQRQYGAIRLINGSPKTAGYTGSNCPNYKGHIAGVTYCIQGNTLLGKKVVDSMEARFKREKGDLACKLMAALQGAKMVGADSRCASNGTSSLFAFLKVSKPSDTFGNPYFLVSVRTRNNAGIEPIDSLQKVFDKKHASCKIITSVEDTPFDEGFLQVYPNPIENTLTIRLEGINPSEVSCIITDAVGKKIAEEKITSEKTIDTSNWGSGIYFLEVNNGSKQLKRKIIKQ